MNINSELKRKFEKYISKVKKLECINNNDKLYLYAHYKQALIGNNINEKPSILNRVDMEKWKAWNNIKDTDKEVSMKNYIKKVKQLYKCIDKSNDDNEEEND
jgi:diazepam-binding inhibitor (GABA receptor modulating acyl-CoA-binding protein)